MVGWGTGAGQSYTHSRNCHRKGAPACARAPRTVLLLVFDVHTRQLNRLGVRSRHVRAANHVSDAGRFFRVAFGEAAVAELLDELVLPVFVLEQPEAFGREESNAQLARHQHRPWPVVEVGHEAALGGFETALFHHRLEDGDVAAGVRARRNGRHPFRGNAAVVDEHQPDDFSAVDGSGVGLVATFVAAGQYQMLQESDAERRREPLEAFIAEEVHTDAQVNLGGTETAHAALVFFDVEGQAEASTHLDSELIFQVATSFQRVRNALDSQYILYTFISEMSTVSVYSCRRRNLRLFSRVLFCILSLYG